MNSEIPLSHCSDDPGLEHAPGVGKRGATSVVSRFDLALAFAKRREFQQSVEIYEEIISLDPSDWAAHNNLGTIFKDLGRFDECERSYREALRLRPNFPEAQNNLGVLLLARGRFDEAEALFRQALMLREQFPEAHSNLSDLLRIQGQLDEAEVSALRAVNLRPTYASGQVNLGNALRDAGRFEEAKVWYELALSNEPEHVEALNNLASLLSDLGHVDEAIDLYRSAIAIRPDYADAHANLALSFLLAGRLEEGWLEYEWRWLQDKCKPHIRDFHQPHWNGEDLGTKVLLVHAEQGFGDTLHFCRFVSCLGSNRRVIFEVQPPLKALMSDLPGIELIVARGEPLPSFDVHCPLMSLPRILGTNLTSIPSEVPYLRADPQKVADWRARLAPYSGLRVGLVWAGNPAMGADRRRSIALDRLSPLADVSGICFVSLQKGPEGAQTPPPGMVLHDWTDELEDFADTAALVEALDLVISVDTAVGHLVGALGRPVWLLNRFDRCWRWLLARNDSPWYPSLRQFRQSRPGDWDSVLVPVRKALRDLALRERSEIVKSFERGVVLHQAGRLEPASAIYRGILAENPRHADSLHLLGVSAFQSGLNEQALSYIDQALEIAPENSIYLNNRGNTLKGLGRRGDAEESFRRAIAITPAYVDPQINLANLLYDSGRLIEARDIYQAVVLADPFQSVAQLGLGNSLLALGYPELAEGRYLETLRQAPNSLAALVNLGSALRALGRKEEAKARYTSALKLQADSPIIHVNLGHLAGEMAQPEDAEAHFLAAIKSAPGLAEAYSGLGDLLDSIGRLEEAEARCDEALRLNPRCAPAYITLGNIQRKRGAASLSEAAYREAIGLNPNNPVAYSNMANLLIELDRFEEAEFCCREALRLRPNYVDALINLGTILKLRGNFDEAEAAYRQALASKTRAAEAQHNLANLLGDLGRVEEALGHYSASLLLKPDYPDAHTNLALLLLLAGRFEEGWQEYEWRWRQEKNRSHVREFSQPLWDGEDIGDRVLLVHAEQGFGDTLQFCRFVPLLAAGRRIVLEVQAPLKPLLEDLAGVEAVVVRGDTLPDFDYHCPLLSLPRLLSTTIATIPAETPYLQADPERVAVWRARLEPYPGLRVGLVWAGNPAMGADGRRSIALAQLSSLADLPGATFVSLQTGASAAQSPPLGMVLLDWTDELIDFAETAALVEALDLIISVDTAVVHLAGALGRPVWLLNRFDCCWRWLLGRDDSPWYPSLRQFRQLKPGDWDSVLSRVRAALEQISVIHTRDARPLYSLARTDDAPNNDLSGAAR